MGVILQEMLSGERPFRGETAIDTMQAILRQDPPELPESVPAAVRQTVSCCLEKEPANRFQSAKDLSFARAHMGAKAALRLLWRAACDGRAGPPSRWRLPRWVVWLAPFFGQRRDCRSGPAPCWADPEMALNPRVSPDGHLLAFQAIDRGLTQVAVMKPESANRSILTRRRDLGVIWQISWSPDGALIFYDRRTDALQGVYSVPLLGRRGAPSGKPPDRQKSNHFPAPWRGRNRALSPGLQMSP